MTTIKELAQSYDQDDDQNNGDFFKKFPRLREGRSYEEQRRDTDELIQKMFLHRDLPSGESMNISNQLIAKRLQSLQDYHIVKLIPGLPDDITGARILEAIMDAPMHVEWLMARLDAYEGALGGEQLTLPELKRHLQLHRVKRYPSAKEMGRFVVQATEKYLTVETRTPDYPFCIRKFRVTIDPCTAPQGSVGIYQRSATVSEQVARYIRPTDAESPFAIHMSCSEETLTRNDLEFVLNKLYSRPLESYTQGAKHILDEKNEVITRVFQANVEKEEPSLLTFHGTISKVWVDWIVEIMGGEDTTHMGETLFVEKAYDLANTLQVQLNNEVVPEMHEEEPSIKTSKGHLSMAWVLWFKRVVHKNKYSYKTIMSMIGDEKLI